MKWNLLNITKTNALSMKNASIHRSKHDTAINPEMYFLENLAWDSGNIIYGVDEAGRGCLAGPVVTAAAMLLPGTKHPRLIDSKKLSQTELRRMFDWLQDHAKFAISIGSPRLIDQHNIYRCTAQQMRQAILHLLATTQTPQLIAIDAMPMQLSNTPFTAIPIQSMIKGESKSASIAAASIIAKVTRDRIMQQLEQSFPGYELAVHKGYCTQKHRAHIYQLQPTIIHRESFLSWFKQDTNNAQQTSIFC